MMRIPKVLLKIGSMPLPGSSGVKSASPDEDSPISSPVRIEKEDDEKTETVKVVEDNASLSFNSNLKDRLGMFPTCNAIFSLFGT